MENNEIRIIGIWNEIKADHHNHVDLLKNALDKEFHKQNMVNI